LRLSGFALNGRTRLVAQPAQQQLAVSISVGFKDSGEHPSSESLKIIRQSLKFKHRMQWRAVCHNMVAVRQAARLQQNELAFSQLTVHRTTRYFSYAWSDTHCLSRR
jgi:hypothetical protein